MEHRKIIFEDGEWSWGRAGFAGENSGKANFLPGRRNFYTEGNIGMLQLDTNVKAAFFLRARRQAADATGVRKGSR